MALDPLACTPAHTTVLLLRRFGSMGGGWIMDRIMRLCYIIIMADAR